MTIFWKLHVTKTVCTSVSRCSKNILSRIILFFLIICFSQHYLQRDMWQDLEIRRRQNIKNWQTATLQPTEPHDTKAKFTIFHFIRLLVTRLMFE